ncbi:APC family permease [Moraxella sp. ZY210820]|uniref:APC family permease n=1 Tax=unclassified Moraxella TaxID=2685852 RepID=UPI0027319677|nr:APC family permease [Moraxella sp. ZY210820]WLF83440.1 APC family permease [Moraxella sp. ZY210820]
MSHLSDTSSSVKLQKNLLLWHVIIIGLAYIQPMTLFDTFGMVSRDSGGHVPTSYIFALFAILLTSISYGHMIRRYPSSGSAYTYAQKAIHPNVGFMVGWSSWMDYLLAPMINIILARIYLADLFPNVNEWIWVIFLVAIMTIVNIFGARFVARLNSMIVFLQIVVIGYFTYSVYNLLANGLTADGSIDTAKYQLWTFDPFWTSNTELTALVAGATILCFSFTGFDALSSLAEETKDAKRVLPKAIVLTSLIAGIIFIISTYFIQIYFPSDPTKYFNAVDETQPEILAAIFSEGLKALVLYFAIVTVMASGISAHAGVSRLMYVMGRDGVINKKIFAHISPKFYTPTYNIAIVGLIALTAGYFDFEDIVELLSFGALTAFSFVNFSVFCQYALRDKCYRGMDFVNYVLIPTGGFIAVFLMWLNIDPTALKYGLIWAMLGLFYLAWKTEGFKKPAPQYQEDDD